MHGRPLEVEAIIGEWPQAPKKVARETVKRTAHPNEATPTLLIWPRDAPTAMPL